MSILPRTGKVCKRAAKHSERAIAEPLGATEFHTAFNWPAPLPLEAELPPVADFDLDLLSASLRPLVEDVSERMQVPADYPAAAIVCVLAGAVNRRASIQPLANDPTWEVVPNLWGAIIGPPGVMKSPVIESAIRPLEKMQSRWFEEHEAKLAESRRLTKEYEAKHDAWKHKAKQSWMKTRRLPTDPLPEPPESPECRRLIVNDATVEKLHEIMRANPVGVLFARDELTGFLSTLDRDGREGERDFALQCWNGTGAFTVDRIGRGTIHVEACCTSMLGGIQPLRLQEYLLNRRDRRPENDGLIQRFQVAVWPDPPSAFRLIDRAPDEKAQEQVAEVLQELVDLPPDVFTHTRFDGEAQKLFNDWRIELEKKIRAGDGHPALISHIAKYRSLMPSLALLFFLADLVGGKKCSGIHIGAKYAQKAAGWCTYLESHAERIYSAISDSSAVAASMLADKIEEKKIGPVFTVRDIYTKGWTGLGTAEQAIDAVKKLIDRFWIREVEPGTSVRVGRPSTKYEVNPRIWRE